MRPPIAAPTTTSSLPQYLASVIPSVAVNNSNPVTPNFLDIAFNAATDTVPKTSVSVTGNTSGRIATVGISFSGTPPSNNVRNTSSPFCKSLELFSFQTA